MEVLLFLENVRGELWAAWFQAGLSALAIYASARLVNHQHKLERERDVEYEAKRRRQYLESAFQLVGSVYQVSMKIEKWSKTVRPASWECADDLDAMSAELEGLIDALRQVDYGRFDQHMPVEAILVALSAARRLISRIQTNPFGDPASDPEGFAILVDVARASSREIKVRLNTFHEIYPTYEVKL